MTGPTFAPNSTPTRRRALTILAGAACLPLAGGAPSAGAARHRWTGTALGAHADMLFADAGAQAARAAAQACTAEVARLEAVFSLWRGDSELARLNREGVLQAPSLDLRQTLATALDLADASGGAFDPSVQPLWQAYADAAAAGALGPDGPDAGRLARARALVDWRGVAIAGGRVTLDRPGMALTLNGIAQGTITDRVAALLRARGFRHVLVQLGETYALGAPPDADGWRVGVELPHRPGAGTTRSLADRALATSAGAGSPFDPAGRHHHLLDPARGTSAHRFAGVTVEHARAETADALSTALSLVPLERGRALLARYGGRARWVHGDGRVVEA